ncbi:MAG: hypothetical protein AB7N76_30595 [Planctomycetota bacterium]
MTDSTSSETPPSGPAEPAAPPAQTFAVHRTDPRQVEGGGGGGLLLGAVVVAACAAGAWHFAHSSGPAPAPSGASPSVSPSVQLPPIGGASPAPVASKAPAGKRYEPRAGSFALTLDPEWKQEREDQELLGFRAFLRRGKRHRLMVQLFLILPWESIREGVWEKVEWHEGQEAREPQFKLSHRLPVERWATHRRGGTVYLYMSAGLRVWCFAYPLDSCALMANVLKTLELKTQPPWGEELLPRYGLTLEQASGPSTPAQQNKIIASVMHLKRMDGRCQAGIGNLQRGKVNRLGACILQTMLDEQLAKERAAGEKTQAPDPAPSAPSEQPTPSKSE